MPALNRIAIYPLKSFDPIHVDEALVLPNGALQHDRQFVLVDSAGKYINAKRTPLIHQLESTFDVVNRTLSVRRRSDDQQTFLWDVDAQRSELERWFSAYFTLDVTLQENRDGGFPDDDEAPGPTLLSTPTIQSVAQWFPGISPDQVRLRFRANLEIDAEAPFWEDQLFGSEPETARPFRVGSVMFAGTNPCQRCVVPTRDPGTGDVWREFAKVFADRRSAELPEWASRTRFNHYYRLSVNTRLMSRGSGVIRVGDNVELLAE
jgi:uncharacterized protein YcbX